MNNKCIYTGRCNSEGWKCGDCIHNNYKKKDYYEPEIPYKWIYPNTTGPYCKYALTVNNTK